MRIRKSDGEQRPYVQPSPIGLNILPTKKLVTHETSDYASHEETPVSEAQEQHEGSPNKRMKIAMPETYVRKTSAPRRTRTLRKLHSGVATLIESPTPPCPITPARQLSLAAGLLVRMKNGGSSKKRVGKQRPDVRPSPIGLATESRDYSSHEETSVFEAREQHEGTSPKNMRRKKIALQETSVRNARTHSLKVKSCVYNLLDNRFVSSSCGEGTHSHPLPAAAAAIWMDSATSASPEPHQRHTIPDWYNFHLVADMAAKVSEAESGKFPMETRQVPLELGHTLQETKPQSYEGELAMETHQSASKEETAMSKAEEQPQDVNKTMGSMDSTTPATPEPNQPQISLETWLREPDSQSSGEEWAMKNHESASKQESAMSKAEEQPQDANKTMESFSSDTTFRNHPLFAHTRTDGPTVQRYVDNRSALSSCERSLSHPLPAAAAAIWIDSTTSATLEPHQQHTRTDFYKFLNQIFADRNAAKVTIETLQVSLELRNALQETKLQLYEGQSAMKTHESASKEETAMSETGEQPQDANKTMESFSSNTTVCNLPLLPRTDGSTVQTCPDRVALLNPPVSRTDYGFPGTVDLTLHRNPGGGHIQVDAANSGDGMFSVASQSAELQMHASEPMLEATEYPCSAVQGAPAASVSTTSFPICLSNPLPGLSMDESPKARRERSPTIRRQQIARRKSYEAIGNQPGPAPAPFSSTVARGSGPGVSRMQVDAANSGYGLSCFASQSAGLQMHASKPISEAQYPCSAAQRPPAANISPTSFPICLPNPLQVQQDFRRWAPQHPPLLRTAYEAPRNQPLPAVAPFPSTVTQVGHIQVDAAKSAHGMFYFVPQSAGVQMHASEPVLEATQYPCSVAERPPNAVVSPARLPIDLSNPLEIQQAVAAILSSGVFLDKLGAVFTSSMFPLLQGPVSGSPADPLEDGLNESSVITEGSTANAWRK